MKNIVTIIAFSFAFSSCEIYETRILVIDKKMIRSSNRDNIIPGLTRGSIGLSWAFEGIKSDKPDDLSRLADRKIGTYSKSALLSRWGMPDQIEKRGGIEYLIYFNESKKANNYELQNLDKSRPVTLGYSGDHLVYASAYFLRDGKRLVGDVYYCR